MLVHIFAMMAERGLSEDESAAWVAAMFFLGIPLRFILGVTTGKFRSNLMLAGGMAIGAVGMWGLWLGPGIVGLLAFVIGIAVVEGITSVNWLMLSDYFGRARFATLMGFMSLFMNIGLFASPLFAGIVYRMTESYWLVLATFTPMYLVSALAFLLCTRPQPPVRGQRRWIGTETGAPPAGGQRRRRRLGRLRHHFGIMSTLSSRRRRFSSRHRSDAMMPVQRLHCGL